MDYRSLADDIATWIKSKVDEAGAKGIALNLSGGIDSATVAGLAVKAVGPDKVHTLILPIHSNPQDEEHARLVAEKFGLTPQKIDLSPVFDLLIQTLPEGSDLAKANLKPRLRMITIYYIANTNNLLVVGTGNKTEIMVGYYTKYGDGGVDILPIGGLYKKDVRELAKVLGVPEEIIAKPPSAGLWPGQTDEGEMGITYEQLDRALEALEKGERDGIPEDVFSMVQSMVRRSSHKRELPAIYSPVTS
ncbi:NAD+ synthetase [Thermobaculum terrenum ATCC BAA-798]|uniref:NH(3)-dependent NAD(+) synthetase n=1 Tax=Thermobaculum terrenum (strain ATCC BAA-798 / CCMEE 7001 / YNP1) TaxID=525904 RepID=D1CG52_THET1|nr:NAD+ synthase [Thermobaculum terrenum]ACZ41908.1 NAD+ synthetase [Thermobaculum terrenum ATCC BAA-798]